MIDTTKTKMARLYVEQKEEIEGKTLTTTLFIGNSENEGVDTCAMCLQEKILSLLDGEKPYWKTVSWVKETVARKDGSGTYEKNNKVVRTIEEMREVIKAEKKNK